MKSEAIINGEPEIPVEIMESSPEDLGGLSLEQARDAIQKACEEAIERCR